MNVKELRMYLDELEAINGDIDEVEVLYRHGYDSDPEKIKVLEEDLFEQDNETLKSIAIVTCTKEN